jgi:hypothetical protein
MGVKDLVTAMSEWLSRPSHGKGDELVCGTCPRMTSCGLPPSDTCLAKLEHRAQRDSEKEWRRNRFGNTGLH